MYPMSRVKENVLINVYKINIVDVIVIIIMTFDYRLNQSSFRSKNQKHWEEIRIYFQKRENKTLHGSADRWNELRS